MMDNRMSLELEKWLDEWSAKLDSVESLERGVFNDSLLQKMTSFVLKVSRFPQKHFLIALDEEE